jgi:uncharacterized membrane protein (DUF2068 family)
VILIGVFRLAKAALLTVLGTASLLGLPPGAVHAMVEVMHWTGGLVGHETIRRALIRILSLDQATLHRLALAFFLYAVVFTVEGAGLVMRKRWAEWLTVVVTTSFIPLEVYELVHRPRLAKAIALALNVVIAGYLAWRRLAEGRGREGAAACAGTWRERDAAPVR